MYEELYAPLPDVNAYLERIGLTEAPAITPEGLDTLVFAHQRSVPFENYELCELDGHIDISIEKLFDKVVRRRRGGYCFELNGIFYSLLQALGFDVYPVLAKIFREGEEHLPPLHRCNIITIDGMRYFTDVGFGGPMPAGAIAFRDGERQIKPNGVYGMKKAPNEQWIMGRWENG
ncbi:MAG: arylamine N-acetyltransferase, partial [Oscillospiraceae bacterium]|nr:arylamine N-acetyltransferase [Oscillospiraceae bacterium]